jgi:hypothetical protein
MQTPATAIDSRFETFWNAAQAWPAWLETVQDKRDVWEANWRRARLGPEEAARLAQLPGPRRVLVLPEPTTASASARLSSSRVAMRSSSVPPVTSLWTFTVRSWPMR